MKTISLFILAILILLITSHFTHAQSMSPQVINVTGGSNKKASIFLDWSAGELALISTMQNADSSLVLTNGFLQPLLTGKTPAPSIIYELGNDEVNLYPNPTADNLYVTVTPKQKGQIRICLYNQKAGLVYYRQFPASSGISVTIPVNSLVNGLYTLRVELYPETGEPRKGSYPVMKINK
jgi:hypothetical protein